MLHFGWFVGHGFGVQGWGTPGYSLGYDWKKPALYQEAVRAFEQSGLDLFIIEDSLTVPDTYGGTADITVPSLTTYAVYQAAQSCGFSGLGSYIQSWLHCDSRAEYGHGAPAEWSWPEGHDGGDGPGAGAPVCLAQQPAEFGGDEDEAGEDGGGDGRVAGPHRGGSNSVEHGGSQDPGQQVQGNRGGQRVLLDVGDPRGGTRPVNLAGWVCHGEVLLSDGWRVCCR